MTDTRTKLPPFVASSSPYRTLGQIGGETPDLIGRFVLVSEVTGALWIQPPRPEDVDAIMEWLADPDALDWDHLDRIDAEGWRTR